VEDELPDRSTQMLDALSLGLRLREGISLARFANRFGVSPPHVLGEVGEWLESSGFLECDAERMRIADEHQLITNEILVRLEEALDDYVRRETSASQMAAR
jgi:oxygen-independent coproporphyrinogen-3 oxidase